MVRYVLLLLLILISTSFADNGSRELPVAVIGIYAISTSNPNVTYLKDTIQFDDKYFSSKDHVRYSIFERYALSQSKDDLYRLIDWIKTEQVKREIERSKDIEKQSH